MGFESWKKDIEKEELSGFEVWKATLDKPKKVYEAPAELKRGIIDAFKQTKQMERVFVSPFGRMPVPVTPQRGTIEEAGQAIKEIVAAPVRTIESMAAGGVGGLIRMGAEAVTIESAMERANRMIPGYGTLVEGLMRKYGPKKSYSFYNRAVGRLANKGKLIQDYWNEQANKGWEAPNPDIVEARWSERPISKFVSVTSSGLTSIGVVVGTTFLTKSPHAGLALLASSETGSMYGRLRDEDVPVNQASKLALLAGAWTYATEKVGFKKLLAPSKGNILKALKKPGWEGIQEVAETIGHNLLEHWGYKYRRPQDIPTSVKAMYDHAMDGWFDAFAGGVGAGGLTSAALHYGVDRGKRPGKPVLPETEVSPTLALYHGTFDVSAVQKDGIIADETRTGSVSATDDLGLAGKFDANVVRIVIPSNAQGKILDITIDENETATISKGFPVGEFYNPETTDRVARKQMLVGLDTLSPDQKKWLVDRGYIGVKFLTTMAGEPSAKTEIRFAEDIPPSWIKERVEPVILPTPQGITDKPLNEIEPQTRDHVIGHPYGLTNEQIDRRLQQAAFRYRELKRIPTVSELVLTKREMEELTFLEENRTNIDAILKRDAISKSDIAISKSNLPSRPAPSPVRAQMSERRLRTLAQKLRKSAKLSDAEFSNLADITTDKLSIEDMNKAQLVNFVSALEESYSTYGELAPEDYHKEVIVIVDDPSLPMTPVQLLPMSVVHREALDSIEKLKSKKEVDAIIKTPGMKTRIGKSWQWTKSFTAGIKNTPVFHLARRLDGDVGNVFSRVLDKGIEHGRKKAARIKRIVTETIVKTLDDRGVTETDLSKMGRSLNPRFQTHQLIKSAATETDNIEIEGKIKGKTTKRTYQLTMAELIDIYLINNQNDGKRHLKGGGLIINGVRTGKLSQEQIETLTEIVEKDPKAWAVVKTILEVGEIWKKQINYVSQHLDDKDIATIKDWWGLEVYGPARKKLLGRAVTPEEILVEMKIADIEIGRKQELNLIENQGIFHDRTKDKAPLIVRDAFNRLNVFTNAIAEYIGMAGPTRTARTLINDPEVVAMLKEKGYDNVREAIAKIHKRAETIPASEGDFTAWFSKHLPNLYRAVLYANPRVIASQKTSAFSYGAYVSPKFVTVANLISAFKPSEVMETTELSDIAWERYHMARSSLELGEIAESDAALRMWTGGKASHKNKMGWTLKAADLSALTDGMKIAQEEYKVFKRDGKLTGLSEEWWKDKDPSLPRYPDADIELWRKVKERKKTITAENPLTEEETLERLKAEAWRKVVSERAEYLWQRTQPSWDKWNRSLLTSEKGLKRVFLLFRSFHEKSLTIFNETLLDLQNSAGTRDDWTKFGIRSGSVVAGYMFNATIRAAIMAAMAVPIGLVVDGRIQPDKKEWTKYFEDLAMSWFAAFPILGKAAKAAISRMIDTWIDVKPSYTGEPLGSLPIDVTNNALKVPVDFADAIGHSLAGDEDDALEAFRRGTERLIIAIGLLTGFPVYEIKRLVTPKKELKGKKVKW